MRAKKGGDMTETETRPRWIESGWFTEDFLGLRKCWIRIDAEGWGEQVYEEPEELVKGRARDARATKRDKG